MPAALPNEAERMSGWKWLIVGCVLGGGSFAILPPVWERHGASARATSAAPGLVEMRQGLPDFTRLVDRVGPAVVNVTTRTATRHIEDSAERHYEAYRGLTGEEEGARRTTVGIGSGFVLSADGYILTNAHVVAGAEEVYVRLPGRRNPVRAQVAGSDAATDIALLKIPATRLPVVRPGSSRDLKVGDWVAAIGSPFGFDNTITAGIVSAKERRLPHGSQTAFLQSDVAINPGSSGGPLVNLRGEVVGINSKIYTRTGGYMGVSFAIPIETAIRVGDVLRRTWEPNQPMERAEGPAVQHDLAPIREDAAGMAAHELDHAAWMRSDGPY
jgi:serine protease Do